MTVCLTEQGLAQTMQLGGSRKIQEVNQCTSSGWIRKMVLSGIPLIVIPR